MMYLSHLMIDVGGNPDRPRPGRKWLRNVYHVHQRLSMAFPSPVQCAKDPRFLLPFDPAGFERPRFLFRVDNSIEDDCPRAIILVQSEWRPDWDYAFHNARMFLAAEPEMREYNPTFQVGEQFRFRIRVNLAKKSRNEKSQDGEIALRKQREGLDAKGRRKDQGKRVAMTWEKDQGPDAAAQEWFTSKAERCGFSPRDFHMLHLGWIAGYRPEKSKASRETQQEGEHGARQMKFRSALLEGTLAVTDAPAFAQAVASGIGSAKAFGFGLLSIAPVHR
jgi:CRISPR system Cascade subunit CasE